MFERRAIGVGGWGNLCILVMFDENVNARLAHECFCFCTAKPPSVVTTNNHTGADSVDEYGVSS